jgi:hypothetical protein
MQRDRTATDCRRHTGDRLDICHQIADGAGSEIDLVGGQVGCSTDDGDRRTVHRNRISENEIGRERIRAGGTVQQRR